MQQRFLFIILLLLQEPPDEKEVNKQHKKHDDREAVSPLHANMLHEYANDVLDDRVHNHVHEQNHARAAIHVSPKVRHRHGENSGEKGRVKESHENQTNNSLLAQKEGENTEKNENRVIENKRLQSTKIVNKKATEQS